VRTKNYLEVIKAILQSRFRSVVGKILIYLIKHSRPDIANMVRELAKFIDGATLVAYREVSRVIRLGTRYSAVLFENGTKEI
jgi:hypothetical protein